MAADYKFYLKDDGFGIIRPNKRTVEKITGKELTQALIF